MLRRGAVLALELLALAGALRAAQPHKPLTLAEGQALVADRSGDFRVTMNEAVLRRLNGIITDPGRAAGMRESLKRMGQHRQLIEKRLRDKGLPRELAAIPLVESRYENRRAGGVAGLWMFIRPTARAYGLKVDQNTDERLDVGRETDAAVRLLRDEHRKYGDWLLALAAYNRGGKAVDAAIAKGGTRDAWRLVEAGHLNDYLVYVTAAVVLMDHPDLLE